MKPAFFPRPVSRNVRPFEKMAREIPGIEVTAFGREDFLKLGMGGLEGVSRAAAEIR